MAGAALLLLLFTTPPLPTYLVRNLESRFPALLSLPITWTPDTTVHIVVLGAGHTSDPRLPVNDQLSDTALKRLVEGIRIHQLMPNSKLVLSGDSHNDILETQAEVLAKTAIMLGVHYEDTLLLKQPGNTREEAISYASRFGANHPVVLVTTAIHMPRAVMHFRRAGLEPFAAPTNFLCKRDKLPSRLRIWPSHTYLHWVERTTHEYVGSWWGKIEWSWEERQTKSIKG